MEKNELKIRGQFSKLRNCFEEDTMFIPQADKILDLYEENSRLVFYMAKEAVRSGSIKDLRKAQWYESSVQTLEECLNQMIVGEDDNDNELLDFHNLPDFSGQ